MPSTGLIIASILILTGLSLILLPSHLVASPFRYFHRPGRYAQISPAQMQHAIDRLERYIAIKEGERAEIIQKQTQQQPLSSGLSSRPVAATTPEEIRQREDKTKGYLKQLDDLQREIEDMIAERQRQSQSSLRPVLTRLSH